MKLQWIWKNNARIIVFITLLTISIFGLIHHFDQLNHIELHYGVDLEFVNELELVIKTGSFFVPLILLVALLGFIVPYKLGWIMTNTYFTYVLTRHIVLTIPVEEFNLLLFIPCIVFVVYIIIMHSAQFAKFHKIKRSQLLTLNLLTIALGLGYAFMQAYYNMHFSQKLMEII